MLLYPSLLFKNINNSLYYPFTIMATSIKFCILREVSVMAGKGGLYVYLAYMHLETLRVASIDENTKSQSGPVDKMLGFPVQDFKCGTLTCYITTSLLSSPFWLVHSPMESDPSSSPTAKLLQALKWKETSFLPI